MFSCELKKPVFKFLKTIKDKSLLKRIADKIDELEKNPFPHDIERVEGIEMLRFLERELVIIGYFIL